AVAAVRRDQVAAFDPALLAVFGFRDDPDPIGILFDRRDALALEQADARLRPYDAVELALESRLIDRDIFRPAMRGVRRNLARQQYAAVLGHLVNGQEIGVRPYLVDAADLLEHAEHIIVDDADARQVVERLVALQHRDVVAGAAEQSGSQHSSRPVANDDDIIHAHHPAVQRRASPTRVARRLPA